MDGHESSIARASPIAPSCTIHAGDSTVTLTAAARPKSTTTEGNITFQTLETAPVPADASASVASLNAPAPAPAPKRAPAVAPAASSIVPAPGPTAGAPVPAPCAARPPVDLASLSRTPTWQGSLAQVCTCTPPEPPHARAAALQRAALLHTAARRRPAQRLSAGPNAHTLCTLRRASRLLLPGMMDGTGPSPQP